MRLSIQHLTHDVCHQLHPWIMIMRWDPCLNNFQPFMSPCGQSGVQSVICLHRTFGRAPNYIFNGQVWWTFFWYRFIFYQISLWELWCTLQILNHEIADLLDNHVISSILQIGAVADLMNPFLKPCSNPNKIQKYTSKGITIFQLWRKIWQVKKMRLCSWKNASMFSERRRNFIRVGSFKTTEIFLQLQPIIC